MSKRNKVKVRKVLRKTRYVMNEIATGAAYALNR